MTDKEAQKVLGQFIPLHYHFNMLKDEQRMQGFNKALQYVVKPGDKVLELGGGTGVLSFFAAQKADHVYYVEMNPELVKTAQHLLSLNKHGDRVEIIQADASEYLPPEPVDVVVCEMLHVGLLREKQAEMIDGFKKRYLEKFGDPLPRFVPEACIQAVQPVHVDFYHEGYYAPVIEFQNPVAEQPSTQELGDPVIFQMFAYESEIPLRCSFNDNLGIKADGQINALRFITKNPLAIVVEDQSTIDWFNQYLIIPLGTPIDVKAGDVINIRFDYPVGAEFDALTNSLNVTLTN